jgi:hypothetical protein
VDNRTYNGSGNHCCRCNGGGYSHRMITATTTIVAATVVTTVNVGVYVDVAVDVNVYVSIRVHIYISIRIYVSLGSGAPSAPITLGQHSLTQNTENGGNSDEFAKTHHEPPLIISFP